AGRPQGGLRRRSFDLERQRDRPGRRGDEDLREQDAPQGRRTERGRVIVGHDSNPAGRIRAELEGVEPSSSGKATGNASGEKIDAPALVAPVIRGTGGGHG